MGDYVDQADFAGRIGKIAKTYNKVADASNGEIYEATLHICLLHTLLTSCDTVLGYMEAKNLPEVTALLPQQGTHWGLNASMVETTFNNEPLSVVSAIQHMRNAVSHPTPWKTSSKNSKYPSTGFFRSSAEDGQIAAFTFIDSPDVDKGIRTRVRDRAETFLNDNKHTFPDDVVIEPMGSRYAVFYNGKPYARYFKIEFPVINLREFVQELSCFLYEQFGSHTSGTPRIDHLEMEREGRNGSH